MIKTPIAYIVFNRPSLTEKSFQVIREQKPSKLYIIADGPRQDHKNDNELCLKVRAITEKIDWNCEVHRSYSNKNLGLKNRVSSGLDWVFDQVEKAIILEDDCVAHPDFFKFCDLLLDYYSKNNSISVITGNNFQNGKWRGDASYYFSKYCHCWGWATWRRAWKNYQGSIPFWMDWKKNKYWVNQFNNKKEKKYWENIFDRVYYDQIDSWAYPWTASVWFSGGLTVTPNVNLVSNIGFGEDSTHTKNKKSKFSNMAVNNLHNIKHPNIIKINVEADNLTFDNHYQGKYLRFPYSWIIFPKRILRYLLRILKILFN